MTTENSSPLTDKMPRTVQAREPNTVSVVRDETLFAMVLRPKPSSTCSRIQLITRPCTSRINADYRPRTNFELELVARLVSLLWRLRRAVAIESGLFDIQAQVLRKRSASERRDKNKLSPFYALIPALTPIGQELRSSKCRRASNGMMTHRPLPVRPFGHCALFCACFL